MAATTISRSTWTDGASGTVIANARLQGDIYDKIDALIGTDITFGGLVHSEGFGTHTFSAGGSGANSISIRNTSAGTANGAILLLGNDAGANQGQLRMHSTTFTPSGAATADGLTLQSFGAGGLNINANVGAIGLYTAAALRASVTSGGVVVENTLGLYVKNTAGSTIPALTINGSNAMSMGSDNSSSVTELTIAAGGAIRFRMNSAERIVMTSGGLLQVADGSVSAPGFAFLSDTDTGLYLGGNPTSGGVAMSVAIGGAVRASCASGYLSAGTGEGPSLHLRETAVGTGQVKGAYISIGRNSSGNTAAGTLRLERENGTTSSLWVDTSGNLRIGLPPDEDNTVPDTNGTVVGTQSSSRTVKQNITAYTDTAGALRIVRDTPVFRFRYTPGGGGIQGEDFIGIITEESPMFGMDRDDEHPAGKSLNTVNAIGLLIAAHQELAKRLEALES